MALSEVWERSETDRLTDRLHEAASAEVAMRSLERALLERHGSLAEPDPEVLDLVDRIQRRRPRGTPGGLGERQLRRRFRAAVGYGPKVLERVVRFQGFLGRARSCGPDEGLAQLALVSGYADQAHLSRECRRLAGKPPSALLGRA